MQKLEIIGGKSNAYLKITPPKIQGLKRYSTNDIYLDVLY
jgi:hypothetical protein